MKMPSFVTLSSVTTWTSILTVVAAIAASVFHHNLAQFVAPAAILMSGFVVSVSLFAKHHFAAGVAAAEATLNAAHIRVGITPPVA